MHRVEKIWAARATARRFRPRGRVAKPQLPPAAHGQFRKEKPVASWQGHLSRRAKQEVGPGVRVVTVARPFPGAPRDAGSGDPLAPGTTRQWMIAGAMLYPPGAVAEVAGAESSSDLAGGQDVAADDWVGRRGASPRRGHQ